jgi:hypothetical protein
MRRLLLILRPCSQEPLYGAMFCLDIFESSIRQSPPKKFILSRHHTPVHWEVLSSICTKAGDAKQGGRTRTRPFAVAIS